MILWTSRITPLSTYTLQGIILLLLLIIIIFTIINVIITIVIILKIVMMAREGDDESGSELPKSTLKAKQQIFLCR